MVEQTHPEVPAATQKTMEGIQELGQAAAERAGEAFSKYSEEASVRLQEFNTKASALIKDRPITSVMVAFGAGLLLGLLLLRK